MLTDFCTALWILYDVLVTVKLARVTGPISYGEAGWWLAAGVGLAVVTILSGHRDRAAANREADKLREEIAGLKGKIVEQGAWNQGALTSIGQVSVLALQEGRAQRRGEIPTAALDVTVEARSYVSTSERAGPWSTPGVALRIVSHGTIELVSTLDCIDKNGRRLTINGQWDPPDEMRRASMTFLPGQTRFLYFAARGPGAQSRGEPWNFLDYRPQPRVEYRNAQMQAPIEIALTLTGEGIRRSFAITLRDVPPDNTPDVAMREVQP